MQSSMLVKSCLSQCAASMSTRCCFRAICTRRDVQTCLNHFLTILVEVAVARQLARGFDHLAGSGHANGLTVAAPLATFLIHARAGTKRLNQDLAHLGALWNFAGVEETRVNLTRVVLVAILHCCNHIVYCRARRVLVCFANTALQILEGRRRDGASDGIRVPHEKLKDEGQV